MDLIGPNGEIIEKKASFYDYHDNTFNIISRVAYLIGVPKKFFESDTHTPELKIYNQLEANKNARVIRNLCMLRTAIEINFRAIFNSIKYDLKNLYSLPEYIPQDCLVQLEKDGITIVKPNTLPGTYIIDINKYIIERVESVKNLFPNWLEWSYVRDLFIMPDGLTDSGIKAAAAEFYANRNGYPYGVYINWPYSNSGNILYTDSKFAKLLYESHEDSFSDLSKVTDAGEKTKNQIYEFLDESKKAAIVVDCENSDPFKLFAMLNSLEEKALLNKISKLILFDDINTNPAWNQLDCYTSIPVEYILTERLKEKKSLNDVKLTAGVCREHYINQVDAFILASSDSDFWGLISAMPELKFYVLVEGKKVSAEIKSALDNGGYAYCYMDNFCTGNSSQLKEHMLLDYIRDVLEEKCSFNAKQMLRDAQQTMRIEFSETEEKQFYDRFLKPMKLVISKDGDVKIELGR